MHDIGLSNWVTTQPRVTWSVLGIGVGCLMMALLLLTRSRWGHGRPLSKCVVLSVFVHGLLLALAYTTNLLQPAPVVSGTVRIQLTDFDEPPWPTGEVEPWVKMPPGHQALPKQRGPDRLMVTAPVLSRPFTAPDSRNPVAMDDTGQFDGPAAPPPIDQLVDARRPALLQTAVTSEAQEPQLEPQHTVVPEAVAFRRTDTPLSEVQRREARTRPDFRVDSDPRSDIPRLADIPDEHTQADATRDALVRSSDPLKKGDNPPQTDSLAAIEAESSTIENVPHPAGGRPAERLDGRRLPTIYQPRVTADRMRLVIARGGSQQTEAGVTAALKWLSDHQGHDGRWTAREPGVGGEADGGGHDRGGDSQADTGTTGLALLAFLGAGHTHVHGDYRTTVGRGLDYLLRTQRRSADGSLAGNAGSFAAMYCHGIATLVLSEAYALTGDPELEGAVTRAVAFTVAAQHPVTGGWRYFPHDQGDTSQLGWQLMALTSAHFAGFSVPATTWRGARRFLRSVSQGSYGGLASYRPGELPTTTMTAEALLCRLFLRAGAKDPDVLEAASQLLGELPGEGLPNFYYWYYGTLALYHLHDDHWETWNAALKRQLLNTQRPDGPWAGSWDTNTVWGRTGGRVYTTSLGALSLEVYYRYVPLNPGREAVGTAQEHDPWQPAGGTR